MESLRSLLVLLLLAGCLDSGTTVHLRVNGASDEVRSLRIEVRRPDQAVLPSQTVSQRLDRLTLRLHQLADRLEVKVIVSGRQADGCVISRGEGRATVEPGGHHNLAVALSPRPPECRLLATTVGGGAISAEGVGLQECRGRCAAELSPGRPIQLTARPDPGSYFAGWSGACSGRGTCTVETGEDRPVEVSAGFVPRQVCGERLCWESPLPQGGALLGLWGASAQDVWAVGAAGVILHWNGSYWAPFASGTSQRLLGIWGLRTDAVWAFGEAGALVRWDGQRWRLVSVPTSLSLWGMWGIAEDKLWLAASMDGQWHLLYGSGDQWEVKDQGAGNLYGIWGATQDHVWAFGETRTGTRGLLRRWNGLIWSEEEFAEVTPLRALWGPGPDDVWAVGGPDGSSSEIPALRWNGTRWIRVPTSSRDGLWAIWGSGPKDAWAVGSSGIVLRWDGQAWASAYRAVAGAWLFRLRSIWGSGRDDVWVVGDAGELMHWNGAYWSSLSARSAAGDLWSVYSPGEGVAWAVGDRGTLLRRVGTSWLPVDADTRADLVAVSGSGPADLWAVGSQDFDGTPAGVVVHWDGQNWRQDARVGLAGELRAVWSAGPGSLWIAGHQVEGQRSVGAVFHLSGGAWTKVLLPEANKLTSIWGSGPDRIFAAGWRFDEAKAEDVGVILHWNGTVWRPEKIPAIRGLTALWGSGPDDVWAVNGVQAPLRWNGTQWSLQGASPDGWVTTLWGRGRNDIWGLGRALSHWDGADWSRVGIDIAFGGKVGIIGLGGSGADLWLVGEFGWILHGTPDQVGAAGSMIRIKEDP